MAVSWAWRSEHGVAGGSGARPQTCVLKCNKERAVSSRGIASCRQGTMHRLHLEDVVEAVRIER
jgi:hypothetical protein